MDAKSSNILLDDHMRAKVGDFGFAMKLPTLPDGRSYIRTLDERGTPGYIAPEYQRGQLGPKVDVFALGVVILEAYSELKAYDARRDEEYLKAFDDFELFKGLSAIRVKASVCEVPYQEIQVLAKSCLCDREDWLTMEKVVETLEEILETKMAIVVR